MVFAKRHEHEIRDRSLAIHLLKLFNEATRALDIAGARHRGVSGLVEPGAANLGDVPAGAQGTLFAIVYRRLVPRLGHAQAIGAITHRLCRLIWKLLHEGIRYVERGPAVSAKAKKVRARKMIRELRRLGYRVELLPAPSSSPA